ncbi:MAG: alcohol dehydrogenase catalytic domain-containing protein [Acidobacteriota bacterium]|nr:alcohol dehydrogenase catalytic domain-containing protein [Acidobacteriota bacterium]
MNALRFENNRLNLVEIEKPRVAGEALIRVLKSGICNTDLEIVKGYAGFSGTLGHEFVGVVEASDDVNLIGKRVVGEINAGCGECEKCRRGDARHCPARTVLGIIGRDGAHAEFVTLPTRNLLEVPDEVSDTQAVFVEPLAAAFGITEQVEIHPETRIAVIGDGKLGNLCAQSLALKSENLFLIGKHQAKLDLIKGKNIETILLDSVSKLNRSFDVVVEASGSESGFSTALDLLKPRGRLVLKSTFSGKTALEMWRVVVDEITIIGSRCGRFAPALELLKNKSVEVESLVSAELSLRDGVKAMGKAAEKGVMKVILSM